MTRTSAEPIEQTVAIARRAVATPHDSRWNWDVIVRRLIGACEAAWEEGFTACAREGMKQRDDPSYPITRTNPYAPKEANDG